jgi:hypothetical protein
MSLHGRCPLPGGRRERQPHVREDLSDTNISGPCPAPGLLVSIVSGAADGRRQLPLERDRLQTTCSRATDSWHRRPSGRIRRRAPARRRDWPPRGQLRSTPARQRKSLDRRQQPSRSPRTMAAASRGADRPSCRTLARTSSGVSGLEARGRPRRNSPSPYRSCSIPLPEVEFLETPAGDWACMSTSRCWF